MKANPMNKLSDFGRRMRCGIRALSACILLLAIASSSTIAVAGEAESASEALLEKLEQKAPLRLVNLYLWKYLPDEFSAKMARIAAVSRHVVVDNKGAIVQSDTVSSKRRGAKDDYDSAMKREVGQLPYISRDNATGDLTVSCMIKYYGDFDAGKALGEFVGLDESSDTSYGVMDRWPVRSAAGF